MGRIRGARYLFNGGVEDHGNYKVVDLKALGNFNFDQAAGGINDVPAHFRKLDGECVQLTGFMWSPSSAAQLKDFQFVYNVAKCCFNGPPLVQERVFAHILPGSRPLPYVDNYVKLTGVIHVDVKKQDGVITSVYTLDVEKFEKA